MLILFILIYALGNNLKEAEGINASTATVDLANTQPVICVGSHVLIGYDLSVAVVIITK